MFYLGPHKGQCWSENSWDPVPCVRSWAVGQQVAPGAVRTEPKDKGEAQGEVGTDGAEGLSKECLSGVAVGGGLRQHPTVQPSAHLQGSLFMLVISQAQETCVCSAALPSPPQGFEV